MTSVLSTFLVVSLVSGGLGALIRGAQIKRPDGHDKRVDGLEKRLAALSVERDQLRKIASKHEVKWSPEPKSKGRWVVHSNSSIDMLPQRLVDFVKKNIVRPAHPLPTVASSPCGSRYSLRFRVCGNERWSIRDA